MIKQIKRFSTKKIKKKHRILVLHMLNQHLTIQLLILQINKGIHFFGLLQVEVVLKVQKKVRRLQPNLLPKRQVH